MVEGPIKIFETLDPKFAKLIENTNELALSDGALPRKVKCLIGMALDAVAGTTNGVKSLAQQALNAGATKEEVVEALRVAQYINGVGPVYTAAPAFKELFPS
ncbi:MAG: carboxymuconolactone decarboxylase family protein [Dehalococcoidales bacterium]|nr:carboxymuconolactone decarboxylase family protein [Dehalococcoidales bacterium]